MSREARRSRGWLHSAGYRDLDQLVVDTVQLWACDPSFRDDMAEDAKRASLFRELILANPIVFGVTLWSALEIHDLYQRYEQMDERQRAEVVALIRKVIVG